jgi:hypothetical protein
MVMGLTLRHRWSDFTTQLTLEPLQFLERLAALTPSAGSRFVLYYRVLTPRARDHAAAAA